MIRIVFGINLKRTEVRSQTNRFSEWQHLFWRSNLHDISNVSWPAVDNFDSIVSIIIEHNL